MAPPVLYKYFSYETTEVVLKNGRLRWSSPQLFNDPAEFQRLPRFDPPLKESLNALPQIFLDAAAGRRKLDRTRLSGLARQMLSLLELGLARGMKPEEFLEVAPEETRELDKLLQEQIRSYFGADFIRNARVMCLTGNQTNPAMWANYAGNHSGCVLGFRHVPEESTPFMEARPVTYSSEPPVLCSGLDFYLYFDELGIGRRVLDAVCFTKRSEWQYEEEWRAVTWRTNEGGALFGDYAFLPQELESVTFGLRTLPEHKDRIKSIVEGKYFGCAFYQVEQKHGDFHVRLV